MKRLAIVAGLLVIGGCITGTPEDKARAVRQMPADYKARVVQYYRESLKDPYSIRDAQISQPLPIFVGRANGYYAPGVCVRLNGKNSFGAYIGLQTRYVAWLGDRTIESPPQGLIDDCENAQWAKFKEIEDLKDL